nr:SCAN domain-containing protein 3-like [Onthophagus taurus]
MERWLIPKSQKTRNQDLSGGTCLGDTRSDHDNEGTGENVSTPSTISSRNRNYSPTLPVTKKTRQYSAEYLSFGFTEFLSSESDKTRPQCFICSQVLANDSMKPAKLRHHFETKHPEFQQKPTDFFKKKEQQLKNIQRRLSHIVIPASNNSAIIVSFKVCQLIAQKGKPHTIAEDFILPAAKIMVSAIIGDQAAKEITQIPLSNNTVQRRIQSMAENIKDQLMQRVKIIAATDEKNIYRRYLLGYDYGYPQFILVIDIPTNTAGLYTQHPTFTSKSLIQLEGL